MGNKIKELRRQSGFTQEQLGNFLEVDQSMIAKLEKGERSLTTVQLGRLANLFACSEEYLLGYSGMEAPIRMAFRLDNPTPDSMRIVAAINKVASNINLLNRILEADNAE